MFVFVACTVGVNWGQDCGENCSCSDNVESCDIVTGCTNCRPGFSEYNCKNDINECDTEGICPDTEVCLNTIGSYRCLCKSGRVRSNLNNKCVGKYLCMTFSYVKDYLVDCGGEVG